MSRTLGSVFNIGSDTGCGCEFRHALKDETEWIPVVHEDEAYEKSKQKNHLALYNYILSSGSKRDVEIYGCWDGDTNEPAESRESINLTDILNENFFFKERVLHVIHTGS